MGGRDVTVTALAGWHGRFAEASFRAADGPSLSELVVAAQDGSALAFEDLVRQLGPLLYRFLVVRLRSEADARDALQETLIVAWQRLPELRDPRSCRSWMLTIALRKGAEIVKRRPHNFVIETPVAPFTDMVVAVELDAALAALPGEMRDVVLLRYLVGLSEEETATVLHVRVGTVKSRASRARRQLAQFLHTMDDTDERGAP